MKVKRMGKTQIAGMMTGIIIGSLFMPKVEAARAERRYQLKRNAAEVVEAAGRTMKYEIVEKSTPLVIAEEKQQDVSYISLGTFRLTAYCPCKICCGQWSRYRQTASQTRPKSGWTVAVNKGQIPLGTHLKIDGHAYMAEDTGIGVGENVIDIYMDNHEAAIEFGVQYCEVWAEDTGDTGLMAAASE